MVDKDVVEEALDKILASVEPTSSPKEQVEKFILKLKEEGWKISETTDTAEKIMATPLHTIIVNPPNSKTWSLVSLRLEKRQSQK